ncbi:MAG: M24 family metallopeptidase [Candidatus Methanofastidiosia archaeon]
MNERVKKIYGRISEDIDVIVLANHTAPHQDISFFYVTGYESGEFEGCVALLYPDGEIEVIVSCLEETSARKGKNPINVFKKKEELESIIKKKLAGKKRIGINPGELTYYWYLKLKKIAPAANFIDCSKEINLARATKDKGEIEKIKNACRIASRAADKIPDFIHEGVKENEVAAEIEYAMAKLGSQSTAFTTISSFGKNTAEPHYTGGQEILKKNEFILFDFGALYKHYVSDITRTFFYGKASCEEKKIYQTVAEAQQIGFDEIEAGKKLCDPHNAVAEFINKGEYKGRFIHSLGHAIGLSVHEPLGFSPINNETIEEGMVLTVEPGIYIPGHGGVRIEDDIVVKKSRIEILTDAKKSFLEL